MAKEFPLQPNEVPKVDTKHRKIQTSIPVPETIPVLEKMRDAEPRSMGGQPPILWDHAEGVYVYDAHGNKWIDFSSGVLVASSGYGHPKIKKAMTDVIEKGIYHTYCFPTDIRARLVEKIVSLLPEPLKRVFLLTTGSEATECCIKLARTYGLRKKGPQKNILVTFENGFHGRTMGAQLAGGSPGLKEWLGGADPSFVQVPFPEGFRCKDTSFEVFEKSLKEQGVDPQNVCAVMTETYQGCNGQMWPRDYAKSVREWCNNNDALLIFDEIQAGFGRTGKWFGFQHLDVPADLAAFGKGVSGGMPLSAVVGREDIMNLYGPGEMTSTHSANPVCSAAAFANIEVIEEEGLVDNAAKLESDLKDGMARIEKASRGLIGKTSVIGLIGAAQFAKPGTTEPDPETCWLVVKKTVESGVMLFAPVGVGGSAIKINPPLLIEREAFLEGLEVVEQAVAEVCAQRA